MLYRVKNQPKPPMLAATLPPARREPNKLLALLRSRKFWALLVGLLVLVIEAYLPDFPIDAETLTNLVYVLVAYILGVALEDGLRGK